MGGFISKYITGTETTGNDLSRECIREKIEEFIRDFERIEEFVQLFEEEEPLIESYLRELSEIADGLDEVNMKATIAKTTGSSINAAGGIMTIAGLALAPFTLGAYTVLTAAGAGAGVAGGLTNVTTEIVKASSDGGDNKRVEEIVAIIQSKMSALGESVNNACLTLSKWDEYNIVELILKAGHEFGSACRAVGNIASMVRTYQILRANPALNAASVGLSVRDILGGCAVAGVSLIWDVYDISMNLIDIDKGCKTERAKEIRELVENVKGDLKNLEGVYSNMKGCM